MQYIAMERNNSFFLLQCTMKGELLMSNNLENANSVKSSTASTKSTNVSLTDNNMSDKLEQLKKVFDGCSYEKLKQDRESLEECFKSIKKSHDEFIVYDAKAKVADTLMLLKNESDEKFNQGCIDNVKNQVKVMNEIFKKYDIDNVSTSIIEADNILERAVEIFAGDGYYLKGKINTVIYRVKCNLKLYNDKIEKINSNIKDLSSISKLIDSAISDMNSAISILKDNDIVSNNFSVVNNYTKSVKKTRNNLRDLKATINKYTKDFFKIEKIFVD